MSPKHAILRLPSFVAARGGAVRTAPAVARAAAAAAFALGLALAPPAGATVYYVSSSTGSDGNSGTSAGSPFETIAKVNTLNLQAGDQVRLFCGDIWRDERLFVLDSGTAAQPITVTSHPLACANQPVISGAQPIVGWTLDSGNVYRADLAAGGNAGRFTGGVVELFENGERLPYGRWPNLGTANGGYSTIDAQSGNTITDNQLPAVDWTGAYVQYRSEFWYLFRRNVTADAGNTLTLNAAVSCHGASCVGWGFFLNHHRSTLDQDGEWYYDAGLNRVYVVSTSGPPADGAIEGSVRGDLAVNVEDRSGVIVGGGPTNPLVDVDYVVIDNLEVRNWAGSGIQMGRVQKDDENHNITIRNNTVVDVALFGIRLTTFVFEPDPGNGPVGTRGGRDGLVQNNLIDGANLEGIELYSVDTVVERNTVRNIGLMENLNADGLGCPLNGGGCAIRGNGIRILVEDEVWSGNGNTIRLNRLEQIGWTGIDVKGPFNLIEHNVIVEPASTLAEGAGVRLYDGNVFANTRAHDITVRENVILDPVGETGGVGPPNVGYQWGFGINVDYADDVEVIGNTVRGATSYGVIFSFAQGTATDNVVWNNSTGASGAGHFRVLDAAVGRVTFLRNQVYGRLTNRPLLSIDAQANLLGSDDNYFFNPYTNRLIRSADISTIAMSLPEWQAASGLDLNSSASWFSLTAGEPDLSVLFVNDTEAPVVVPLAEPHFDLDQNVVAGSFTLDPFSSRILITTSAVIFADGFESGDTASWSSTTP
ncbi:MAG: right-handed parallel beta-helix repeat-containing protein [Chloroflexi bacterium]|nr:right-handed parallel beta-helix repeat-containing protein [Chloroflexota bacterium]